MGTQPQPESIFDTLDEEAEEKALAEAEADAAAGRYIPFDEVRRWLRTWGKSKKVPPPKCE